MNNVERARCIIQEFNKNYRPSPCCCISQPSVVPGNMTLQIGTVTTGAPGTAAVASITGTAPNFFLNLTIPQGITGPTGPIGPTGPAGETGPTGPATISAYGGLYNTATQTISLTDDNSPYTLTLGTTLPAMNVTYAAPNTITVLEPGTYEISYNANASTSDNATGDTTLVVNANNNPIESTSITATIGNDSPINYNGTTFAELTEGTVLDITLANTQTSNSITVDNARLSVVKVS